MKLLSYLASLRLTVVLLTVFMLGVLVAMWRGLPFAALVAACLSALALNLVAALVTRPTFRKRLPLLIFHLALMALLLLVALGRLTYLKGQAEVLEGEAFDGQLVRADAGIWHPWGLDRLSFVNHGFSVAYAPGLKRLETRNRVTWQEADGREVSAVIGDDKPLVLDGYRFYTTWNKGFALVFEWYPQGNEPMLGSVHLPSYPLNALKQAQQWQLPGLREPVWAMLQFDENLIPEDRDGAFRLPDDYKVVVRHGEQRWEIAPDRETLIELPGGQLRYAGLRTWMGYSVTWDATLPWLLGVSALAALALSWHFWQQFSRRPWNPD